MQTDRLAMASDFDGTLYFMRRKEKISPENIAAVQNFQKAGNLFGMCSGRSLRGITGALEGVLTMDFYILVNGALIADRSQKTIYKKCVPLTLVRELYEKYEGNGSPSVSGSDSGISKAGVSAVIQANDTVYSFYDNMYLQTRIHDFQELEGGDIYGISFGTGSTEAAVRITQEINRDYGDICIAYTNVVNVDVVPTGCSKGNALQILKNELGLSRIAGIGDSFNDIPLLEKADRAYTFPQSPEKTKQAADIIVENVAQALDEFTNFYGKTL